MTTLTETLFYKGGTVTDAEKITVGEYSVAINDNYIFVWLNGQLRHVCRFEACKTYAYKITKSKIIGTKKSIVEILTDAFWRIHAVEIINAIVTGRVANIKI